MRKLFKKIIDGVKKVGKTIVKVIKWFDWDSDKTIAYLIGIAAGFILGFDRAYRTQVPPEYRDPSPARYFTGRALDIDANGVWHYTITGNRKLLYK